MPAPRFRQSHRAESSGPGVQAQIGGKISGQKLKMKFLVSLWFEKGWWKTSLVRKLVFLMVYLFNFIVLFIYSLFGGGRGSAAICFFLGIAC